MGIKRIVDTAFWEDEKVMMEFTPEDKLFFLYLMTNPHTTQLGIYKIIPKQMAFEIGYSLEAVGVLMDRFENKYKIIKYSKATSEVAIKNYLRYSIVKGGKPVEDLLEREAAQVKNKSLFEYINMESSNLTIKDFYNKIINIKDNDNDNDNDNEDSYHESYNESSHESYNNLPEEPNPKQKYGEYRNVRLQDKEYAKLCEEYDNADELITFLDEYIEMKGYKAKNHYLAIKKWVVDAVDERNRKKPKQKEHSFEVNNEMDSYAGWLKGGSSGNAQTEYLRRKMEEVSKAFSTEDKENDKTE